MIYQDLKEDLATDPAKYVMEYLAFHVEPEKKAREVGQKIWQYYLNNDTVSYGTNLVKLAEVWDRFSHFQTKLLYTQIFF